MGPEGPLQMVWSSVANESLHTPRRALTATASKDHWHWSTLLLNTQPRCSSSLHRWHPFICLLAITVRLPKQLAIELQKTELLKDQPVRRARSSSSHTALLTHWLSLRTGALQPSKPRPPPSTGHPASPPAAVLDEVLDTGAVRSAGERPVLLYSGVKKRASALKTNTSCSTLNTKTGEQPISEAAFASFCQNHSSWFCRVGYHISWW